ncbi:hypothetical protein ACFQ2C_16960 [Sphingobacterium daejeonense]|uniref:YtkA-like domain-containing protein n=1 Tax=Sphingobacterium daejeonense TaxID=371142 RepID=A0ABW3RQ40_9SPHI
MKRLLIVLAAMCLMLASCTKAKTDYEGEIKPITPGESGFKEAVSIKEAGYEISILTENGAFYKGYNELKINVVNAQSKKKVKAAEVSLLPISTDAKGSKFSGPHLYNLKFNASDESYSGYAVFPEVSANQFTWKLYLKINEAGKIVKVNKEIKVQEQTNKNLNMTSFIGNDNEQYWIALISPRNPKVGENDIVAGIYKYNKPNTAIAAEFPDETQFSFSEAKDYVLQLDPRMPEPSMGNHSSPNNKDLIQGDDGLYHGVVNYTMTGNWTLNFIMQNQVGKILKGTIVPTTFTPGVEGVKSELHIDILF